jgi:methylenetetrahydrofolate reductase (NADPH)
MADFSVSQDAKLKDIIEAKKGGDKPWVSVEFFPPKTTAGITTLFSALTKLLPYEPVFSDFTWGAGGSTSDLTIDLCIKAKEEHGQIANMHLTCTNVDKEKIDTALETCKSKGITNILALRGDPPVGQDNWEASDQNFTCALDLVRYIRSEHGDYFNLTVAGYPEGHPNKMTVVEGGIEALSSSELGRYSISKAEDGTEKIVVCLDSDYQGEMDYLKQKIDAGADCIITQMFFDAEVFNTFVKDCRNMGINVPIIPGIMMLSSLGGFNRMTEFCKTRVPAAMTARIAEIEASAAKGDCVLVDAIKAYGVEQGVEMCQRLTEMGTPGLHFYTLNQSATTLKILNGYGYKPTNPKQTEQKVE